MADIMPPTRGIADPASPPTKTLPWSQPLASQQEVMVYPQKIYGGLGTLEMVFDGTVSTVWAIVRGSTSMARLATSWVVPPMLNVGVYYGSLARDVFMLYWSQSAVVRAFVYMFGLLTFVPVVIFSTYTIITLAIVTGIASTGFMVVQALVLGAGLFVLGPVILMSMAGALFIVAGYKLVTRGLSIWAGQSMQQQVMEQRKPVSNMPAQPGGIMGALGSLFSMAPAFNYQQPLKQSMMETQPSVLTR